MNNQELMEGRLWSYIDGLASLEERSEIETMIATHLEWRRTYNELLEISKLVQNSELEAPSLRFAKNVMEEISKYKVAPATRSYINKKIIWGIGGFFIACIVGFLVYGLGQVQWSAPSGKPDYLAQYTPKVDYTKIFNNNYTSVFIMISVVLGLILLDLFLQRRKELLKESA
jgi:hypothetical protein